MKSYNVKYDVGQEVYMLNKKAIYKSKIEKIRIVEQKPFGVDVVNATKEQQEDAKEGICIEYLFVVDIEDYGNSQKISYDWYNQADVFAQREELIDRIK